MKALVVYDSVFGNTEQVAQAVAQALGPQEDVELLRASQVAPDRLARTELLVVGSPTRGFRPTEAVAALLKAVPSHALDAVRVAAFDTRFKADELDSAGLRFLVKTGGYAAKRIASQLKKAGGSLAAPPEGFYVEDTEGPLKAGELDRAKAWATRLVAVSPPAPSVREVG
jgi:flavodoxin